MPRYFFNTHIADDVIADDEGEELRDPDQAWEVAKAMILELIEEEGATPELLKALIVVTDSDGDTVLEFPFSEALIAEERTPPTKH
jgi:hypothetical protein